MHLMDHLSGMGIWGIIKNESEYFCSSHSVWLFLGWDFLPENNGRQQSAVTVMGAFFINLMCN